jgi:imidazoleglycerol phosphate synthase glutamine amidotransferase subunit HisH
MFIFSNKTYDRMKWIAQILLPAVGTLVFGIAQIWHVSHAAQIVGTITAVDVFLGIVLGLSASAYSSSPASYDGVLNVDPSGENKDLYSFEVTTPLADLPNKDTITFKVKPADEGSQASLF